jgi:hypothetical protein
MVSTPAQPKRKKSKDQDGKASGDSAKAHAFNRSTHAPWVEHLARRKQPRTAAALFGTPEVSAVQWELPAAAALDEPFFELLAQVNAVSSSKNGAAKRPRRATSEVVDAVAGWISGANRRKPDIAFACECLALAYQLPSLAALLSADTWWELHELLQTTARESSRVWTGASLVPVQMLAGELPLVLAYQFPELKSSKNHAKRGAKFLAESMLELLDGQGMPHARDLVALRPLFACWTRTLTLLRAQDNPKAKVSKEAWQQYEWLIRQVLRTTRRDLRACFDTRNDHSSQQAFRQLVHLACDLAGDAADRKIAASFLREEKSNKGKVKRSKLPEEMSYQSDWAELAVMRTGWSAKASQLTVTYHDKIVRVELSHRGRPLLSGDWMPSLQHGKKQLLVDDDWSSTCWFSDEDVDYLELQTTLDNGTTWQRQFLLARQDQFLMTMDVLLGNKELKLDYRSVMPLVPGVTCRSSDETWETKLVSGKHQALLLPLSLPEWRQGSNSGLRTGQLSSSNQGVELVQSDQGTAFCFAQFIDLHPRRAFEECTWRQLTVAETLRLVRPEEAVGFRVQVGHEQWLIYRSLKRVLSRSILGQHLSSEFMLGRFLNNGDVEALVEVEEETE